MIDYEKILDFLIENDLEFNEFMLLYTLHLRNLQEYPELYGRMDKYYSKRSETICYKDMIDSLEERDFLENFNKSTPYIINRLKISEKFTDLLFIDPDDVWKELINCYPSYGEAPSGYGSFKANRAKEGDKEYFIKNILKNSDKIAADRVIEVVKDMFDYDEKLGKPTKNAEVGLSRFLLNWDVYLKEYEETKDNSKNGNWSTKIY